VRLSTDFHRLVARIASSSVLRECEMDPFDMEPFRTRGFSSQFGQDVLLDALLRGFGIDRGVFVDVGAHDGSSLSNTWYFERKRAWTGICIEPAPALFARLVESRSARCFNCAIGPFEHEEDFYVVEGYGEMLSGLVSTYDLRHRRRLAKELRKFGGAKRVVKVPVRRLDKLLDDCEIRHVDFLSIDVEGGELGVVESLDFSRTTVIAVAVENNYGDSKVRRFMARETQLRRVLRIGADDIFLNLRAIAEMQPAPPNPA
jgi:FkbM family methyltransferase